MNIEVNMDSVVVEGQTIKRPDYMPRKWWLEWWESVTATQKKYCKHCGMSTELP